MASRDLDEGPAGAQRAAVLLLFPQILVITAITSVLMANLSNQLFLLRKVEEWEGKWRAVLPPTTRGQRSPASFLFFFNPKKAMRFQTLLIISQLNNSKIPLWRQRSGGGGVVGGGLT